MRSLTTIIFLTVLLAASSLSLALDKTTLEHLGLNESEIGAMLGTDGNYPGQQGNATDEITWTSLPDAPVSVCRAAIGRIGNYVYIFGGLGTGGGSTALAFNLTTLQWESSTAPTITGYNWASAVVGDSILYVWPPSFNQTTIQSFTPTAGGPTGVWNYVCEYPFGTCMNAVAWDGGNFIYSACSMSSNQDQVYRFNISGQAFEQVANLPEGRGYAGGACVNGKFYVLGGSNSSNSYTTTTYEYDPATNTWATKAPMLKASSFNCFNTTTDGNLIYLVGGGGGNAASIPATDTVQVYDPSTDTWTFDTPRWSATTGANVACYVEMGHYIIDCGGRDLATTYHSAFRGDLPGGPTNFRVILTPHNTPIRIPATGGAFTLDAAIENNLPDNQTLDAWTDVVLPNGSHYGPLVMRSNLLFPAGATVMRTLTQRVPPAAFPGSYDYWGYVGFYPDSVFRSDSFSFNKLSGDALGGGDDLGWSCTGWFDEESPVSSGLPADYSLSVPSPNPFNPTTTIGFTLPEAGKISLMVYDVQGRAVANLSEGWCPAGNHSVIFDGAGLSSGVYFYQLTAKGFSNTKKMMLVK